MRLFFDEDRGNGVAAALFAVGITTEYVGPDRPVKKGTPDEDWIPLAGHNGWLVLTANRAILRTETQRRLWIDHGVGGVFLSTNRIRAIDELRLLLKKMAWLNEIDSQPRPFAYILDTRGNVRRVSEIN